MLIAHQGESPESQLRMQLVSGSGCISVLPTSVNARYTIDGTLPTSDSPYYTEPVCFDGLEEYKPLVFTTGVALGDGDVPPSRLALVHIPITPAAKVWFFYDGVPYF